MEACQGEIKSFRKQGSKSRLLEGDCVNGQDIGVTSTLQLGSGQSLGCAGPLSQETIRGEGRAANKTTQPLGSAGR